MSERNEKQTSELSVDELESVAGGAGNATVPTATTGGLGTSKTNGAGGTLNFTGIIYIDILM